MLFNKCRKMKKIILLFGFVILLSSFSCKPSIGKFGKPNIVIIYVDDLGYGDLSTYGGDIPSPNIQRLADSGIKFTDFYVSAPACTPSRYSLLTGHYPQRSIHNLIGALMPEHEGHLDKSEKILPEYLKEFGYATAIFGKWHLGNSKNEYLPCFYGFDKFVGHTHGCIDFFTHVYGSLGHDWYEDCQPLQEEGFATDLITKHAIKYLSAKDDNPFFVFLSYNAPHYGKSDPNHLPDNTVVLQSGVRQGVAYANTLQAPPEYLDRFDHVDDIFRKYYSAMVSNLDDNIGEFINYLEYSEKIENTIIWFISDNGGYSVSNFGHASNGILKGEKAELSEGGIRIPSILTWKGKIDAQQITSQPAANIDVLPTLLDIIIPDFNLKHYNFDGVSLMQVLLKNKKFQRDIFWQYRGDKAFRRGDWKIFNQELYNLANDISEEVDLSGINSDIYDELNTAWNKMVETLNR
jgi:arylsulfatase A-like enzyme